MGSGPFASRVHVDETDRRAFLPSPVAVILLALCLISIAAVSGASDPRLRGGALHTGGVDRYGSSTATGLGGYPDALPRFHNGVTVVCADCHIIHASKSHSYESPRPGEEVPYTGGANKYLLKVPDPVDLCLSCHDGQTFAPDVLGHDTNGLIERSAGFFEDPETINPKGHDLGRGLSGDDLCFRCHFGGTNPKVTCIDCHDPHGNNVARNLQWASSPEWTPDLALFVDPAATGMGRYEAGNVSFGTLNTNALREVSSICIDCHHVFSGAHYVDPDGDGIHSRHPSYNSEQGSPNNIAQGAGDGGSDPAHWQAGVGSGFWTTPRVRFVQSGATDYNSATTVDASTNGVFCLSCHKVHGGTRAFGLVFDIGSSGAWAPGCDQCHKIADVPGPPGP